MTTNFPNEGCPCDAAPPSVVPAFVGNDYFVRVAYTPSGILFVRSILMMFSGMVRIVHPPAHAVSSTEQAS